MQRGSVAHRNDVRWKTGRKLKEGLGLIPPQKFRPNLEIVDVVDEIGKYRPA